MIKQMSLEKFYTKSSIMRDEERRQGLSNRRTRIQLRFLISRGIVRGGVGWRAERGERSRGCCSRGRTTLTTRKPTLSYLHRHALWLRGRLVVCDPVGVERINDATIQRGEIGWQGRVGGMFPSGGHTSGVCETEVKEGW